MSDFYTLSPEGSLSYLVTMNRWDHILCNKLLGSKLNFWLLHLQGVWPTKWSSHAKTSTDRVWCLIPSCYTLHFLITASWSMAVSGCYSLQHSLHINTVEIILQPAWRISGRGFTHNLDWCQDRLAFTQIDVFRKSNICQNIASRLTDLQISFATVRCGISVCIKEIFIVLFSICSLL